MENFCFLLLKIKSKRLIYFCFSQRGSKSPYHIWFVDILLENRYHTHFSISRNERTLCNRVIILCFINNIIRWLYSIQVIQWLYSRWEGSYKGTVGSLYLSTTISLRTFLFILSKNFSSSSLVPPPNATL